MQNKTLVLDRSPQHKTENSNPNKIITPPIVGVPIFFIIWSCGPSSRIGLTIFLFEKKFIKGPPINKTSLKNINVVGKHILHTYKNLDKHRRGVILKDKSKIIDLIKNDLDNNDYLMVKASNATGFNKIISKIKG